MPKNPLSISDLYKKSKDSGVHVRKDNSGCMPKIRRGTTKQLEPLCSASTSRKTSPKCIPTSTPYLKPVGLPPRRGAECFQSPRSEKSNRKDSSYLSSINEDKSLTPYSRRALLDIESIPGFRHKKAHHKPPINLDSDSVSIISGSSSSALLAQRHMPPLHGNRSDLDYKKNGMLPPILRKFDSLDELSVPMEIISPTLGPGEPRKCHTDNATEFDLSLRALEVRSPEETEVIEEEILAMPALPQGSADLRKIMGEFELTQPRRSASFDIQQHFKLSNLSEAQNERISRLTSQKDGNTRRVRWKDSISFDVP